MPSSVSSQHCYIFHTRAHYLHFYYSPQTHMYHIKDFRLTSLPIKKFVFCLSFTPFLHAIYYYPVSNISPPIHHLLNLFEDISHL